MPPSSSDARVVLQQLHDVLVVPMHDPLSQNFFNALNQQLSRALHHRISKGVVLDMAGVELLDATDFAQLHRIWKTTRLLGGRMILAGLTPGVSAALVTMGVEDDWVQSALSVELAMEKLS